MLTKESRNSSDYLSWPIAFTNKPLMVQATLSNTLSNYTTSITIINNQQYLLSIGISYDADQEDVFILALGF